MATIAVDIVSNQCGTLAIYSERIKTISSCLVETMKSISMRQVKISKEAMVSDKFPVVTLLLLLLKVRFKAVSHILCFSPYHSSFKGIILSVKSCPLYITWQITEYLGDHKLSCFLHNYF